MGPPPHSAVVIGTRHRERGPRTSYRDYRERGGHTYFDSGFNTRASGHQDLALYREGGIETRHYIERGASTLSTAGWGLGITTWGWAIEIYRAQGTTPIDR